MKYFVSYTTRDKEITLDLLQSFSNVLLKIGDAFIDILDNNSLDWQGRVISELDSSDILLLIETKNIRQSHWVSIEVERAKSKNIPIKAISVKELEQIIETGTLFQIPNYK